LLSIWPLAIDKEYKSEARKILIGENLALFQIFSEAKRAEDRGCDSEDEEGENLRPEDGDSVSF
jgi:hypothetical protein